MGYISGESRYQNLATRTDIEGRLILSQRVPHRYEEREDNIYHVAAEGDSWWSLAERYYDHISSRACGLWWVLLDYQPNPVVDPTRKIRPGTVIALPPPIVVVNEIIPAAKDVFQ